MQILLTRSSPLDGQRAIALSTDFEERPEHDTAVRGGRARITAGRGDLHDGKIGGPQQSPRQVDAQLGEIGRRRPPGLLAEAAAEMMDAWLKASRFTMPPAVA